MWDSSSSVLHSATDRTVQEMPFCLDSRNWNASGVA